MMSTTMGRIPSPCSQYVLIYAPWNKEEIVAVIEIAASIKYITGLRGVR